MRSLSLLFGILFNLVASAQTESKGNPQTAITYNDKIVELQTKAGEQIELFQIILLDSSSTYEQAEEARKRGEDSLRTYLRIVQNMASWKGDTAFKNCAVRLFAFYLRAFQTNYATLTLLVYKENLTEAEDQELDASLDNLISLEKIYSDAFIYAQENFAKNNNFTLIEN